MVSDVSLTQVDRQAQAVGYNRVKTKPKQKRGALPSLYLVSNLVPDPKLVPKNDATPCSHPTQTPATIP